MVKPKVLMTALAVTTTTLLTLSSCSSTQIIESPKTAFVAETAQKQDPAVIWTSRTMTQGFDYLGLIKVRSWSYQGALTRLVNAGRELRADAVVDVHYETVGFLDTMQAFAVKFK